MKILLPYGSSLELIENCKKNVLKQIVGKRSSNSIGVRQKSWIKFLLESDKFKVIFSEPIYPRGLPVS